MCAVVGSSASGLSTGLDPRSNVDEPESPAEARRPTEHRDQGRTPGRGEQPAVGGDEQEQAHRQNKCRQPEPVVDPGRRRPSRQPTWPVHQRVDRVRIRVGADRPEERRPCQPPRDRLLRLASRQQDAAERQRSGGHQVEQLSVRARVEVEGEGRQEQSGRQATKQPARPHAPARGRERTSRPLQCSLRPPRRRLPKLPHLASVDPLRPFDQRRNTTRDADRDGFGTPPSIHGPRRAPSVGRGRHDATPTREVGDVRNDRLRTPGLPGAGSGRGWQHLPVLRSP